MRTQTRQDPETVGHRFEDRSHVRNAVQGVGNFRQDLGAPMVLPRHFVQAPSLKQASQLTGEDRSLGGKILAKETRIGIVQEGDRSDHIIQHHQGSCHHCAGPELRRARVADGIDLVDEERAMGTENLGRYSVVGRLKPQTPKPFCHEAIGFGAHHLIQRQLAPEINAADLKKGARLPAEQLDERARMHAFSGCA